MHVLFDNGVPRGVASGLQGHVVKQARDRGWDNLRTAWPLIKSQLPKIAAAATPGNIAEVKILTE